MLMSNTSTHLIERHRLYPRGERGIVREDGIVPYGLHAEVHAPRRHLPADSSETHHPDRLPHLRSGSGEGRGYGGHKLARRSCSLSTLGGDGDEGVISLDGDRLPHIRSGGGRVMGGSQESTEIVFLTYKQVVDTGVISMHGESLQAIVPTPGGGCKQSEGGHNHPLKRFTWMSAISNPISLYVPRQSRTKQTLGEPKDSPFACRTCRVYVYHRTTSRTQDPDRGLNKSLPHLFRCVCQQAYRPVCLSANLPVRLPVPSRPHTNPNYVTTKNRKAFFLFPNPRALLPPQPLTNSVPVYFFLSQRPSFMEDTA